MDARALSDIVFDSPDSTLLMRVFTEGIEHKLGFHDRRQF
jgi:hypothetical protein